MRAAAQHLEFLDSGGEIVTATARQARALRVAFGTRERAAGREVWPTPRVVPWSAWLERAARLIDDRPLALDDYAAVRLWQLIVDGSPAGAGLVSSRAAGGAAARAWELAHDWRLDLGAIVPATPEQAAFGDWAREFERRSAARGALDAARLPGWLTGHARELGAALTATGSSGSAALAFHGFVRPTPARAALEAALRSAGVATRELALAAPAARVFQHAAATPDTEFDAIAGWLAARLAADPGVLLGVIVPDLAGRAAPLRRLLDDLLQPALLAPGAPDARPYALAAAPRLADYAVIETASLLLRLASASMDVLAVGQLLRSPYLPASGEGLQRRARLDGELRRMGARLVPGDGIAARIRRARAADPELASAIEAVRRALDGPERQSAARWAEAMQQALRAAGWPKGRALATNEYQAARTLHDALASLSGLAGLLPSLTFDDACRELDAILAATPCPPDVGEPQVLVLDRLEDPGIAFDGLWVAGLNADRFPAAAVPNPFLPLALQRARGLPGATPAGVLEDARRALAAWQHAAPEVIFSWPCQDGEATLLRSTLLPAAPEFTAPAARAPRAAAIRDSRRLVRWVDTQLPALASAAGIAGGVRVLELQSLCPFRAGAEFRLDARALDRPTPGVSPRLRGELMHAALKTFWGDVGSHAELLARGAAGRQRAAAAAVGDALGRQRGFLPGPRLVAIERAWLERSLLALAECELVRAPFTAVELEERHVLDIGGRALHTRLDRLDRLDDGGTVLIDYKTGRGLPRRWVGQRPDALQLPIYAAYHSETPVAVAFARLPLATTGFDGIAERDGILPKVPSLARTTKQQLRGRTWADVISEWRAVVARLAGEFASGSAVVDPTDEACEQCALASLCRIEERALADPELAGNEVDAAGNGGSG